MKELRKEIAKEIEEEIEEVVAVEEVEGDQTMLEEEKGASLSYLCSGAPNDYYLLGAATSPAQEPPLSSQPQEGWGKGRDRELRGQLGLGLVISYSVSTIGSGLG